MEFRKYDHVERIGHSDVSDLLLGTVHIFPKLDGTNASVWKDGNQLCAGSRTRQLSPDADNAGFLAAMNEHLPVAAVLAERPGWRVYGEWLVPHTLKTYREDAWRKFWVFDVHDGAKYLPFEYYAPILEQHGVEFIAPLCTFSNPSEANLQHEVEQNTYLIADGAGVGEGIVIKNYQWQNKHGRQPWGKIVRNEFKEDNRKAFGMPEKDGEFQVELAIAEEFVTATLVGKERTKIVWEYCLAEQISDEEQDIPATHEAHARQMEEQHRGKIIPELLGRVYHCIVVEELWMALKKHKAHQVIDFRKLRACCIQRTKTLAQDLF